MGALPPVSPWKPEDDLLLKNSVEAGGSLESLAKGAVRFSQRFTIREIQERWHSLLYDPDISVESAENMIELERSAYNLPLNKSGKSETSKDKGEGQKRKVKSVRSYYYAFHKRIRSEPLNQDNLDFVVPPVEDLVGGYLEIGNDDFVCPENIGHDIDGAPYEFDNQDRVGDSTAVGGIDSHNVFEDNLDANGINDSDANENCNIYPCLEDNLEASFHHLQYSSPSEMHLWRNMNSISDLDLAGDSHLIGENQDPFLLPNEVRKSSSEYDIVHSEADFESQIACDDVNASSSCPQYDLDAFDTLLNLSDGDDDEMLSMDDEVKEFDKYGLSNLLLDFPSDMNEHQVFDDTQVDTSVPPEAEFTGQLNNGDTDFNTSSQVFVPEEQKLPSVVDTNSRIDELCKEVYKCMLNTEDLEVPNNDDVIFPSKSSLHRKGLNQITRRESSFKGNLHNKHANESGLTLVNRELKIFGELHTQTGLNHSGKDDANLQVPKSADFNTNYKHPGTASCSKVPIRTVAKQTYSDLPESPVKSSDLVLSSKEKQEKESVNVFEVNTQSETVDEMALEAALEQFLSDGEEEPSDDDEDDDIPCVSDVELVIHDMDLDLGSGDLASYSSRTVAKYQTDEAIREIIRSEQSWNASRHRAIASNGAFAYLFGCNRKTYYIKKPEVLIGRATHDFSVDIDLGKERRANKISRRQAFIKIDENGEFHLRNLGKCAIELNGKELFPGQSLILESNSHIKIRGMDFTFEKNKACVKEYLDAISRTN